MPVLKIDHGSRDRRLCRDDARRADVLYATREKPLL